MIHDAVRASEVASFQHVLAASCCLPTPPRFSFGTFPADVALHYYSAMHLPDAGVLGGADFELCDGYTLHHRGRLVLAPELKIHPKHLEAIDPTREAGFAERPRRHIAGQAAFIMGAGHLIYGHWLVDILPKSLTQN